MSIKLRSHHLLCMLTYAGEGYSPAFTAGFDAIVRRIGVGEEILLVSGPDDICAPLLETEGAHCRRESVGERDRQADEALSVLLARPIGPGERIVINPSLLQQMRSAFAAGTIRTACAGCEWAGRCTAIAASRYRRAKLAQR